MSVEALTEAIARASAGRFAVVEVSGAAGMGKTHVLAEAGRLARAAGVPVLLLDDLQWAHRYALEHTEYLIRHPLSGGVLMVVAFRDARPPSGVVDAINHAREGVWRIRLGPLRERDVRKLVPHCSDRRRQLLMSASLGNPRFLQLLGGLPDATLADLVRLGGDFELTEPADAITHVLTAELALVSTTARVVAQAIAISGAHAALDLVGWVAQLPVAEVMAAMDELCGAGLGTMDGAWFTFQHPLLSSAARAMAGPAWRTRAHARAAAYLRSHDGPARLLAHHLERSAQYGDESAATVLLKVGRALVYRAPVTAVRLLDKAFRIQPARPADLVRHAQALVLAGDLDRGWDLLRDGRAPAVAAEIARLRGDLDTATVLLVREANIQRAALAALREDFTATAEYARRYDGRSPVLVAAALILRAWAALHAGEVAAARTHAFDAATLVDGLSNRALVPYAELIGLLAAVETRLGNTATHLARAYEVIDQTGQRSALPYILIVDATRQARLGRLRSAIDLTEQAASAAERMGSAELSALAQAVGVGPLLWVSGPAVAREPRSPAWRRIARLNQAIAHVAAGDADAATALLTGPEWPADPLTQVLRLGGLAQARALAGEIEAAERIAGDAELVALASGLDYEIGLAWYAKASVVVRAGDAEHAGELAAGAARRFATCSAALDEARAHHLAALCRPGRMHTELGLAKAGYVACGADWLLSTAVRDQRRMAARTVRRRRDDTTVLTVRERQVADLVAGGLTNQQIADRLFLSRRTVESHLSRIFPKLAVRSRFAMARRLNDDGDARPLTAL